MDLLIMNKDTICGKWVNNRFTVVLVELLPIFLKKTGDVEKWLEVRAIDGHRANSRLLKKALRLGQRDDISTVISVNAVTITDNFWVKPVDSSLMYSDVRFKSDYFATLALWGGYDSFNRAASCKNTRTPELTNIGSFEKCWRLSGGKWWMYKKASHDELFSELFIYRLGLTLGFNMAEYKRGDKCIKTKDFTDDATLNFESAYSFMGDIEDYVATVEYFKGIDADTGTKTEIIKNYVQMLFLDTICANPDMHTLNFGVLTDTSTGKIIKFAPNFDNNMALISRGYPKNINRKKDLLVKLFNELMAYDESLKKYIPSLTEETIKDVLAEINMKVKSKIIIDFVMNGCRHVDN